MRPSNDNYNHPEHAQTAHALLRVLLKDKYSFTWDLYLSGLTDAIHYILSSPVLTEKDKGRLIADRLCEAARYCRVSLNCRADALATILPSLQTWLCMTTPLRPRDSINPALPVFQPPSDISRL